ncbi:MAG: lysophospholipid acyltransferase family protein [Terracidiphilus sp.]|nr:lysophospholipid acyltransferase family protein [Terracidiphilus sp.]MDR3775929.1 lysophospholipid acyltransferase family protein [Terracidiphilus sp.]
MIYSISFLITVIVLGLPAALVFIPLALITGNVMPLYRVANWIARTGVRMACVRVEVAGLDLVPAKTACIFMANHVSNLDPPVIIPRIPGRTSAFLKRSLMKIPALGYAMKLGEFVPVERSGSVDSARRGVRAARHVLGKGIHITTFVEGTRSVDGHLLPFKKGPFYLAMEANAPCIPVSIWGTETMMAKGSMRIHPGTAHVTFHAPVYPADYVSRAELSAAVRAAIASGLPEWMRQ